MVDGINAAQGIKPKDLTIDWNDCTANEILEYKDEGQEIPNAILVWAQDMAKNQAGADEITYEMSMDNPDTMSATTAGTADLGTAMLSQMEKDGVTKIDQAIAMNDQSRTYVDSVVTLENDMENILAKSEEGAYGIEEYSNNLLSQIQTLKAKQENLKNDKSSNFAALNAMQIENQIKELASLGLNNIETQAQSVYNTTNGIDSAYDTTNNSRSIGKATIDIGNLVLDAGERLNAVIGRSAINSGNDAVNEADTGDKKFNETADSNKANEDIVNNAKSTINTNTGIFGITTGTEEADKTEEEVQQDAAEEAKADNKPVNDNVQNATDKFEQDRENNKEQAEIDPTLADTSITTDPNEILKRKERKGLA